MDNDPYRSHDESCYNHDCGDAIQGGLKDGRKDHCHQHPHDSLPHEPPIAAQIQPHRLRASTPTTPIGHDHHHGPLLHAHHIHPGHGTMAQGQYEPREETMHTMFPPRHTSTTIQSRIPLPSTRKRKDPAFQSPLCINPSRTSAYTHVQSHQMELTCLNLNMASDDSTESDFWILPDFDEWELDSETATQSELAPLLRRAASSNRERLRARLQGDGWDFVGGKYGEMAQESEEPVDDEFDVVVLPVVAGVGC